MERHTTFKNERGRRIRLEVRKHLLEDLQTKGFTYIMTGPYSTTEQTMTRMEAHLLASMIADQMGYKLVERDKPPTPKVFNRLRLGRKTLTRRAM